MSFKLNASKALLTPAWSSLPVPQGSVSWTSLPPDRCLPTPWMPFKKLGLCDFTEVVCGYVEMDVYSEYTRPFARSVFS